MTPQEYADLILQVRDDYTQLFVDALPAECVVKNRYILSGKTSEENWVANLREDDGTIRKLVILMTGLPVGDLGQTMAGGAMRTGIEFKVELFHEYRQGTDADNTERTFIEDAAKVQYVTGKNRVLAGKATIIRADFQLGIRPSEVQVMHYGVARVPVDLRSIQY